MIMSVTESWATVIKSLTKAGVEPHDFVRWASYGIESEYTNAKELTETADDQLSEYGLEEKEEALENLAQLDKACTAINRLTWDI